MRTILTRHVQSRYLPLCALCLAACCIFILPFLFPPSYPAPGQSYVVGYNNKVASLSLATVSAAVFLLSLCGSSISGAAPQNEKKLSWRWLAAALALVAAWNGALSWLVFAAHGYGIEDFYFLPQLEKYFILHRHRYREVEFAYGPLLFYPPVWVHWLLSPWQISLRASYYIATLGQHLAGVAMLWLVVDRLPMQRSLRIAGFASLTLFSFTPLLGPNYTLLRYMLPVVLFVLLTRIPHPYAATAAAFFAQMLVWLESTEMAIAFCLSVLTYCGYRVWRSGSLRYGALQWLMPIAAVAASTALYLAILGREVLSSLVSMSRGWASRVPLPSLEVATLLLATVWLVPRLVAGHINRKSPDSGLLLGLYAMGLALLPAALGPADIVHIAGNGMVLFLLSLVAIGELRAPARALWGVAVAATYLLMIARVGLETHFLFYPDVACVDEHFNPLAARLPSPAASRLHAFEQRWPCTTQPLDITALHKAIGDAPFATPYPMPEIVEEALPQLPNYVPSYWSGTIDLWDAETQQRKVAELRQVDWALMQAPPVPAPVSANLNPRLSIPTHYRALHSITWDGLLAAEIDRNWAPEGNIGNYILYHRVH
jgi:hypothetical protein